MRGGGPCPDLAVTSTSLKVQGYLIGDRPGGIWRIQRRGPGTASFSTIASKTLTAGGGYESFTTTATGSGPARPTGSAHASPRPATEVCGTEIHSRPQPPDPQAGP